jgi:hypothetical protein
MSTMLLPRVRDFVGQRIQQVRGLQAAQQGKLGMAQAIKFTIYMVRDLIDNLKLYEAHLGRSEAIGQCLEAVNDLCTYAFTNVEMPYVPALVTPILVKFVSFILGAAAEAAAEIFWDRMQPAPLPVPVPAPGAVPTGAVPTGQQGPSH